MSDFPDFTEYGYQIDRELGHNRSNGRVTYLAINQGTQAAVVIKQFQFAQAGSTWSDYQQYEQEMKLLQRLKHPSIPSFLSAFETPTGFCLVQAYKPAPSLAQRRIWTVREVRQIAEALLNVLIYLQQQQPPIIHRDIKPENVLVDRQNSFNVYLVDFGFARLGGGELAVSSMVKGTMGFMPPEQLFNRELTVASDLYSLGVTLLCLLTGTRSSDVGRLINENYSIAFEQLPKQGRALKPWLMAMTAPKVVHRYPDARAALQALRQVDLAPISNLAKLWKALSGVRLSLATVKPSRVAILLITAIAPSLVVWPLLRGDQSLSAHQARYYRLLNQANLLLEEGITNSSFLESALPVYDSAIRMHPKQVEAWYDKGLVLMYLQRDQEALPCFETALQPDMDRDTFLIEQVWWKKAFTLARLHQKIEAIAAYDRALQINPNLSRASLERAALIQGDPRYAP
ncbi:protein kinase domain-containing protein [Stenomitos frigidus]|uniref:Serine/threonine protein kinase n=1 Tax=Stenomitos frigidus ULC18 TaxID=2107698 RepID=A0A2T1ECR0_9CYAN|nr:serine/threonine-protein kinase [Stenomitos frigidus]PSB30542.1 serine/threonine protein kinase [Stenomitos frigidus ULC18]